MNGLGSACWVLSVNLIFGAQGGSLPTRTLSCFPFHVPFSAPSLLIYLYMTWEKHIFFCVLFLMLNGGSGRGGGEGCLVGVGGQGVCAFLCCSFTVSVRQLSIQAPVHVTLLRQA